MDIEKLIEILQTLRPGSVVLDCSAKLLDSARHPSLNDGLSSYDGWLCATIRILTPPPE